MEHSIVSIILIFNIFLMILYFVMKLNRRSIDRAREAYTESVVEDEKRVISNEDHQKIEQFLSVPSIPVSLSQKPSFTFNIHTTNLLFVNKGKIDKKANGFGVVISSTAHQKSTNFTPLIFLDVTKKGAFYIKSDDNNLIGLFTPFHIVIFNPDTMQFTRSAEDEKTDKTEEIKVTSYTRENVAVDHFVLKVTLPFLDPCQFIETYYPGDYKDASSEGFMGD